MHESTQQMAWKLDPEPVIEIGATMYLIALIAETFNCKNRVNDEVQLWFLRGEIPYHFHFYFLFFDEEAEIFNNFYQKSR